MKLSRFIEIIFLFFLFSYAPHIFSKEFTGTVVPIFTGDIYAGSASSYWGSLDYTANTGEITNPEITTVAGEPVKSGTTLVSMRQQYWQGQVTNAKGQLLAARENLKIAYNEYLRYKSLAPTGAEPMKFYQEMRATFYEALGQLESAKANLIEQQRVLDQCSQISPFEGIVDEVYYKNGILATDPKVLMLSQLNPIGIEVKMNPDEANSISSYTPVSIYIDGIKEPVGVYNGYSFVTSDGIIFRTRNYPKYYTEEKVNVVENLYPVVNFYVSRKNTKALGVASEAIYKDEKGSYVWRAKNNKVMQPGKGLNPIFQIEKIYIKPGNLKRMYNGSIEILKIDDNGKLELHDVVITSSDSSLKEGDSLSIKPNRYVMMPGDQVKIVIEDNFDINNLPAVQLPETGRQTSSSDDEIRHHIMR